MDKEERIIILKDIVDYRNCSVRKTTIIKDENAIVLELDFLDLKNVDMCYKSQVLVSKKILNTLLKVSNQEIKDFIKKNEDAFLEIKPIVLSKEAFNKIINISDDVYNSEEKEYFVFKKMDLKAGIIKGELKMLDYIDFNKIRLEDLFVDIQSNNDDLFVDEKRTVIKRTLIEDENAIVFELSFNDYYNDDLCYSAYVLLGIKPLEELKITGSNEIKKFIEENTKYDFVEQKVGIEYFYIDNPETFKKVIDIDNGLYHYGEDYEYNVFHFLDVKAGICRE